MSLSMCVRSSCWDTDVCSEIWYLKKAHSQYIMRFRRVLTSKSQHPCLLLLFQKHTEGGGRTVLLFYEYERLVVKPTE